MRRWCATWGVLVLLVSRQIQGDFVLVRGDTVASLPLGPALAEHRERRKVDKQAVLTMTMRRSCVDSVTMMVRPHGPAGPVFPERETILQVLCLAQSLYG